MCNFVRGHYEEHFCEINFEFRLLVQMLLKDILSTTLAAILFRGARPFAHFGRGHYQEHFCEIILNLDQLFKRRCQFKYFLSTALVALLFAGAKPFVQLW